MKTLPITEKKKLELIAIMQGYIDDIYFKKQEYVENFKTTVDKEILMTAILENNRLQEMISSIQAVISYLQYGHYHMVGIYEKDLEILLAETKNEFPDYLEEIIFIKEILMQADTMEKSLKKFNINLSVKELIENIKWRYETIKVLSDKVIEINTNTKDFPMEKMLDVYDNTEELKNLIQYLSKI